MNEKTARALVNRVIDLLREKQVTLFTEFLERVENDGERENLRQFLSEVEKGFEESKDLVSGEIMRAIEAGEIE